MSKPIIAVDVDDTLVPHFQDLIDWYNHRHGTNLDLLDYHSEAEHIENWGTTSFEEAVRRVHQFYETPEFLNAKPHEQAVEVLQALSTRFDLVVVTARDTVIEKATQQLLQEHFSDLFGQVHFTAMYSLEGKARTKAEVCVEIGAKYLIDDALTHCRAVAAVGVEAVLYGDYPWSEASELPPGVTRCLDWPAVQEYFDGLK